MAPVLGAIADDFTGATDLANTWVKAGLRVVQVIGVPAPGRAAPEADAVVVALKSRTAPVDEAVAQSLAALSWLRAQGARQILFKYCSTFDSTPQGNIGPVADALLAATGGEFALVCPAFPGAGRTVYNGYLFVGDLLLSDSSMKDHPLTPMCDANLIRLMEAQSAHRAGLIGLDTVRAGPQAIAARVAELKSDGCRYGVADTIEEADLLALGAAAQGYGLVTGGSGIGMGLPENFRARGVLGAAVAPVLPAAQGRALIVAGSCSTATRGQIAAAAQWPARRLDVDRIASGADVVGETVTWARSAPADLPVLVYASAEPGEVAATQAKYGTARAGEIVEHALSAIATALCDHGFTRIVVAGGETSGAVVSALGLRVLEIGPEIAPGVPWCAGERGGRPLAITLKSGNFGAPSFFADALEMLP